MRILFLAIALSIEVAAQGIPTVVSPAGQPGAPASLPPEHVVATIDGKDVTVAEISKALTDMPPEFTQLYRQNPQYAIQQMYTMRFLASEADKAKLAEQSPLKEQLAAMRANILASAMLTYEQNRYNPPREAALDYYAKNQANYKQAKVRLVAVGFKPGASASVVRGGNAEELVRQAAEAAARGIQRSEDEARVRAAEVLEKAKAGSDFESLVAEYSDDQKSKQEKGSAVIGYTSPDDLKKSVLSLESGQLSGPIKQGSYFLVIKVESLSIQPMSEVELHVMQELRSTRFREWFEGVGRRFVPNVRSPEFFTPGRMPGAPPAGRP